MEWTIFLLFCLSAILFGLSMLQRDRSKDVEKQLENLSIQLMKEMHQLEKKVNDLEAENTVLTTKKMIAK
ncbi:MAG: hypothetical protein LRY73_01895 [Bacillus sp. (in: Bacteria)]|nr:hypothetical protein [Bacillus sp. (in: firmicutes)]